MLMILESTEPVLFQILMDFSCLRLALFQQETPSAHLNLSQIAYILSDPLCLYNIVISSQYPNVSIQIQIIQHTYKFKTVMQNKSEISNKDSNSQKQQDEEQITETQILQMLHRKKMVKIEAEFQKKQKGLDLDEFISVMLTNLEYEKKKTKKLTLALIDFFKEVDANGDQTMQWEQFSNHIIQLGLLRNDRSFKNVIKSYYLSDNVVDKQKHQTGIQAIYYFEKLKNLFLIEKQSSKFKVYNGVNANLEFEVNAHKGNILDLQYLENQNLIATSSNDLTINFWDASSFTLKQIVSVPEIQLKIRYANWKQVGKQFLYTGGSDAIIHIYDASTLKQRGTISGWNPFYKSDQQQEGHCSPIGDILPINSQQTLASACIGGNICLWDSNTHQLKKQLRGHNKGVYSLDWCQWSPMNQCLLSAGLDHEAFVWNTYVKDKIFLLRGHNHPLVGVKCLPESPQIITADIAGMVKVWDVRNFLCVQTFNVPVEQLSSFCLTYSKNTSEPMKKRIICSSKKLHFFEYDQPKDQFLTDEKYCIKVIFNDVFLCFITMHADCFKIWDAKNGRLTSVYRQLSSPSAQLTAVILDQRQRKLFVGDSQGYIYTINIKNGAKMKQFQKHNTMVTDLACWTSDDADLGDDRYSDMRRIITISNNSQVNIHDEDAPQDAKSSCRYVMKQHQKGCNSLSIRKGTQFVASGSDDGNTIITNLVSYRHEVMPANTDIPIKKVLFLEDYECLVSVNAYGCVTFYGVGQNKFKNKMLLEKQYYTQSLTNKLEPFPITAMAFYCFEETNLLIIGDEFGNMQAWDIKDILDLLQKSKISRNSISNMKKKIANRQNKIPEDDISMITQIILKTSVFNEDMIGLHFKKKLAHNDGITYIQIIKQNAAFITSSFDCCCHIWNLSDCAKIGSLLLGGDINWKLNFDLTVRKQLANEEAQEVLNRLKQKNNILLRVNADSSEQEKKQYEQYRQKIFSNAKDALQYHKRIVNQDNQLSNTVNILEQANRLEKQFLGQEQDDSSFNLMYEVTEMKKNINGSKKVKGKY